jgi:hypothetical protein
MIKVPFKEGTIIQGNAKLNSIVEKDEDDFWFEAQLLDINGDYITVSIRAKGLTEQFKFLAGVTYSTVYTVGAWRDPKAIN